MDIDVFYEQYNMSELEHATADLFPDWEINFKEMFEQILSGEGVGLVGALGQQMFRNMAGELSGLRSILVTLILIGIASAIFTNISGVVMQHQLAECGFYTTYLIMIIFLVKVAVYVYELTESTLMLMVDFLRIFLPTYFITVGVSGGTMTALGFYQIFMLVVLGIELFLVGVILPAIGGYLILTVINGIWQEEKLEPMTRLLKKGIVLVLKALLAFVSGTGVLQAMITPVIDSAKTSVFQKTVSVIPGIGDLAGSASGVLLGTAVLIKNTVGIVIVILLLLICLLPVVKLFLIMLAMKVAASVMGMVADKRMTGCADRMGDGVTLLLQTMLTAVTFFFVLISIVAFTGNRGI